MEVFTTDRIRNVVLLGHGGAVTFIKLLSQRFDSTIITAVENKTRAFQ